MSASGLRQASTDAAAAASAQTPPGSRVRALAAVLGGLTVLAVVVAVVATVSAGWSWADALDAFVLTNAMIGFGFGSCGALIAWFRPANPIGWLFLTGGLLQAIAAPLPPLAELANDAGWPTWTVRLLITGFVYSWTWNIGLCIPLALMLFPDGHPPSARWRPVVWICVITAPLFALELGAAPEPVHPGYPIAYLTLPTHDDLAALWTFAEYRTLAMYLLALGSLVLRYRRGSEEVRRQLLWLVLALTVALIGMIPWSLWSGTSTAVLFLIPLIPLAVAVAVIKHRLLDIRLVVSRAVTWLLLSLAVLVGYAALIAGLDRLISARVGRSAAVTVVLVLIAALILPRLQRLVDRAIYGDRSNPARVMSQLGTELSTTTAGLSGVAGSIRHALRLPFVAIDRNDERLAANGGTAQRLVELPLTYGGDHTGRLVVGLRDGERQLSEPDRRVLGLVTAPLAAAVHASVVSAQLQISRERLVAAREEERRRLRRELHDELGPTLTGIALTADAAANIAASTGDLVRTGGLLDALRRDSRAALADVRRVAEELRPPALDELGLAGALRQRAEQLGWRSDGTAVQVGLDLPDTLPELPAAVEVAAYRVATEALTNVARHSASTRAIVRLRCVTRPEGARLELSVQDEGRDDVDEPAGSQSWRPGVGLQSMRERVAELGGTFRAGPSPKGGRVEASLPMAMR